ncbi:MAG: PepSY domain-containing protein [Acidobacteria bacterium]|nr:PepSY domain-containing protein [Acidobacteriota bacterium]
MSLILLALMSSFLSGADTSSIVESYHQDWRSDFAKMVTIQSQPSSEDGMQVARNYLESHAKLYGLQPALENLELTQVKQSLLGNHYHFSQNHRGVPVYGAEIVVSVRHDGRVYQVYNNTHPLTDANKQIVSQTLMTSDDAYDIAWEDLAVQGSLILPPSDRLVLYPEGNQLRLVYLVDLAVTEPYGYWEHKIDAVTGTVLDVRQTIISRKPIEDTRTLVSGPAIDRVRAFSEFYARELADIAKSGMKANGTADVFDPDPVTTLMNSGLRDTNPSSTFDAAYFNRSLLDITQSGGTFSLVGPWVRIENFDPPATPPSTTSNGAWTARRGNNAFNDAMSYFHVDQNQRYIQSLGFTGSTGIQFNSIRVDSDGAGGADNSFFSPNANAMSFGHGCVDDNEDAFVILHEYGHALHHSINNNWFGGDTGAMGEGFGDYWAGSYRMSTPNGLSFNPAWAFPWDGHNNCWGGRDMDQTQYQYNSNLSYDAHEFVGGVYSDELWSTPLFQSLLSLLQMGVPRSEVDRVILQAHFGFGSNVKISEMAQAIVNSASNLYPTGPHAQVFHDKFAVHNIQTTVMTPPPPTVARTLVYAWVSNNSQFESIVVVNNYGSTAANLTLTAQRSTGGSAATTRTVPANGFLSEFASSLFPSLGDGTGYTVKVESDQATVRGGWVTNNLEAASGRSPSQGVAVVVPSSPSTAGERVGTKLLFSYLPITNGLTSAPVIVNLGSSNTNVTMKYYNQNGTLIATDTTTLANLSPFRPFAAVANNLVPAGSTDVYMIAESSGALITGVGFVFNNLSEPAIGNVTSLNE